MRYLWPQPDYARQQPPPPAQTSFLLSRPAIHIVPTLFLPSTGDGKCLSANAGEDAPQINKLQSVLSISGFPVSWSVEYFMMLQHNRNEKVVWCWAKSAHVTLRNIVSVRTSMSCSKWSCSPNALEWVKLSWRFLSLDNFSFTLLCFRLVTLYKGWTVPRRKQSFHHVGAHVSLLCFPKINVTMIYGDPSSATTIISTLQHSYLLVRFQLKVN